MADVFSSFFSRLTLVRLMEALVSASRIKHTAQTVSSGTAIANHSPTSFDEIIKKASKKFGVDEQVIAAVINQESSFDRTAVSSAGAQGLMQLMPATAESLGVDNPFDAEQNIMAGTKYLRQKLDEFGGSLPLALAAYNAGSGAVNKYGGIPPYKETQNYVSKVMKSIDYRA